MRVDLKYLLLEGYFSMLNHNLVKNLFYFAVLTTFVVITWIAATIYFSITDSTIPQDTNLYSTPIDPTFDTETLSALGNRVSVPVDLSLSPEYITLPDGESNEATSEARLDNSTQIEEEIEEEVNIPIEPESELTGTPTSPTTIPVSEN